MRNLLLTYILFANFIFSNVSLTIESIKSQNEYFTTNSGIELLQCTLEIGISTDADVPGFQMGISQWYTFGLGLPYGGLVEEYDFTMVSLSGNTIYGGHNMFPQDYYIPAGTSNKTLMYLPVLVSETNDDQLCIRETSFYDLDGNTLRVFLDEESCISIDDICLDENNDNLCDTSLDGDMNLDNELDILDVIRILNIITLNNSEPTEQDLLTADVNSDGNINVLDVVTLVNYIFDGGARAMDADVATMIVNDNSLSLSADGYIGGIQMTLTHANGFELNLTDNAMVSEYKTIGTSTTLVVVVPEEELIFTSNQSFEVAEVIVANSENEIRVETISEFGITAAYPNPFNPSTTVTLVVPTADFVSVKVYNLVGQIVGVLAEGMIDANTYTFTWNATDMSSGVYIIKAESSSGLDVQKVLLVK